MTVPRPLLTWQPPPLLLAGTALLALCAFSPGESRQPWMQPQRTALLAVTEAKWIAMLDRAENDRSPSTYKAYGHALTRVRSAFERTLKPGFIGGARPAPSPDDSSSSFKPGMEEHGMWRFKARVPPSAPCSATG